MADLGLYEIFLEHARLEEALTYRRRYAELRNMEMAFEMPDPDFIGLYRLDKHLAQNLILELEPYISSKGSLIHRVKSKYDIIDSDMSLFHYYHNNYLNSCFGLISQSKFFFSNDPYFLGSNSLEFLRLWFL